MSDSDKQKPETDAQDRFEAVRGKADVKGCTDYWMSMLRGEDGIAWVDGEHPGFSAEPGASQVND